MEALYPENLLDGESFREYFEKVYDRVKGDGGFYTAVVRDEAFSPDRLPGILGELYRKLDENIVIGRSRLVAARQQESRSVPVSGPEDFGMLEYYVRKKSAEGTEGENIWRRGKYVAGHGVSSNGNIFCVIPVTD